MSSPLVKRWLGRWRGRVPASGAPVAPAPAADGTPLPDHIAVDFPASVEREFPAEFAVAWPVVERVLAQTYGADLQPLARRSPALAGYDWSAYLRLSVARMVRAL